jgi:predicted metalloprotease
MRWQMGRRSGNVEDRRGMGAPLAVGGGIGTVILVLVALFLGVDPGVLLQGDPTTQVAPGPGPSGAEDEMRDFVSVVLADTEDVWRDLFRRMNREYEDPRLVLFSGAVESACGFAQAAVGPFYCPADHKVYLDLSFFRDLRDRFRAPGDFAQAYVIAHEVGHHVQALLGISARVQSARQRMDQRDANALSVRLELQADCLAGTWAHHAQRTRQILEPGDVEEALNAASAIGDDRLQQQSRGRVAPDSFTHGTSAQRVEWFRRGLAGGQVEQCNTFGRASSPRASSSTATRR